MLRCCTATHDAMALLIFNAKNIAFLSVCSACACIECRFVRMLGRLIGLDWQRNGINGNTMWQVFQFVFRGKYRNDV